MLHQKNSVGSKTAQVRALAGKLPGRVGTGVVLALAGLLGGCNAQSFMDPSAVGRWAPTPTIMPVLDRIKRHRGQTGQLVEISDPVPGDLIPLPVSYRIGFGRPA